MKKRMTAWLLAACAVMLLTGCAGKETATGGGIEFDPSMPAADIVETEAPAPTAPPETPAFEPTEEPVEAPTDAPTAEPSKVETLYALMEDTGHLKNMAPFSDSDLLNQLGIDPADCQCAAWYVNTEGLCDQVVMAVARDEAGAEHVMSLLRGHWERLLMQYEGYDAEAYAVVKKAELYQDGTAAVLIISPEAAALAEVCRGFDF